MITVNTFSISRLNNQEFAGLMLNMQHLMLEGDRETLGIPASVFVNFNKTLQLLVDQVYSTGQNQLTAAIRQADEVRSLLYRKMRLKLMTVEVAEAGSPLLAMRDTVSGEILTKYGARVHQLPYQEKTAVLHGFIYDLRHKLSESDIELLCIEDDITRLETANNDFTEAYSARVVEKANAQEVKTVKLRAELSELFQRICIVMEYNANDDAADNKETIEACQKTIALLNVILAEAKLRLEQRLRKGGEDAGAGEGDGGDGGDGGNGGTGGNGGGDTGGNGGEASGNTTGNQNGGDGTGGGNTGGGTSGGNTGGNNTGGNNTGGSNTGSNNTGNGDKEPDDGGVINGGNVEW